MKLPALFGGTVLLATMLGGCVVAPLEPAPVVYAAPPPAVVVRPAPRYYYHHHQRYHGRYRYWR